MSDLLCDGVGIIPNDKPNDPIEVEVWASTTLSRAASIKTTDWRLSKMDGYVFDGCNLAKDFKHEKYTIKELLDLLYETVAEINTVGLTDYSSKKLNIIANEGQLWTEDEFEVVEE